MQSVRYSSSILYFFDSLIDLDLAMVKYIKQNYANTRFIDREVISNNDAVFFKALLLERENKNPLSVLLREEFLSSADSLYNEIISSEEEYAKVLELATPLALYTLLGMSIKSKLVTCTVMCKNEQEKLYIKSLMPEVYTILSNSEEFSINNYNCIYVKDFSELVKYIPFVAKDVYVLGYRFNLEHNEDLILKANTYAKFSKSIKFHLVTPYSKFIKPA